MKLQLENTLFHEDLSLDKRHHCVASYIDLLKAFDTVDQAPQCWSQVKAVQ